MREHAPVIEYPHGMPSWVDLSSHDMDASAAFYGELLGWRATAPEEPVEQTGGYRMFLLDGVEAAGLGPAREGAPAHWTTYVTVDDAAAIRVKVEAAGGTTLLEPLAIVDAGTMAAFADAAGGAAFAVWQPGRHRGAQVVNAPGALTMNELDTRDPDDAARFYGEVFGWDFTPIEQGGAMVYGSFRLGGRLIAGLLPMGDRFPPHVPASWLPYFGVADLDESIALVRRLGGSVLAGPQAVPAGRFAAVADAQGAAFALSQGSYDPPPGG
jgi:predicted enzyme related to lactoylglutathione lyase